jgi:hypothetical protein
MKIRKCLVANSSSTSHIIFSNDINLTIPNWDIEITLGNDFGKIEFGWGPDEITDFESKLNFAFLQFFEASNKDHTYIKYEHPETWFNMLIEVLKEVGVEEVNASELYKMYREYDAYIDHASSAVEGQNIEIFESKEKLKDFLFNKNTKLILDNDNYDYEWDW